MSVGVDRRSTAFATATAWVLGRVGRGVGRRRYLRRRSPCRVPLPDGPVPIGRRRRHARTGARPSAERAEHAVLVAHGSHRASHRARDLRPTSPRRVGHGHLLDPPSGARGAQHHLERPPRPPIGELEPEEHFACARPASGRGRSAEGRTGVTRDEPDSGSRRAHGRAMRRPPRPGRRARGRPGWPVRVRAHRRDGPGRARHHSP